MKVTAIISATADKVVVVLFLRLVVEMAVSIWVGVVCSVSSADEVVVVLLLRLVAITIWGVRDVSSVSDEPVVVLFLRIVGVVVVANAGSGNDGRDRGVAV